MSNVEVYINCECCNNKIQVNLCTQPINNSGVIGLPNSYQHQYYFDRHYNLFCNACIKNALPKHTTLMQNSLKKHIKKYGCSVFGFDVRNKKNIYYLRDPDLLTLDLILNDDDFRRNVKSYWYRLGTRVYTKFKYDGKPIVFSKELHGFSEFFYPNTFVKIKTTELYSKYFNHDYMLMYYQNNYEKCSSLFTSEEELKKMNYILLKNGIKK